MKLYRTQGGRWVANQAEWVAAMKTEGHAKPGTPTLVEVPINPKSALVDFLNGLNVGMEPHALPAPQAEPVSEPYTPPEPVTTPTLTLDEMFAKAPVRQRLGLAVSAIDAAEAMLTRMAAALQGRGQ